MTQKKKWHIRYVSYVLYALDLEPVLNDLEKHNHTIFSIHTVPNDTDDLHSQMMIVSYTLED